ncbi:MAG: Histidinol-phosphate aminotransferase [Phycisphaerae bacterium]|nr:Histidinol-phosphate aminotransferase [Phycisphaerae bacterium]
MTRNAPHVSLARHAIRPNPAVAGERPYRVPRVAAPLDLFLDGNEGAVPSMALIDVLHAAGPEVLRRYPDAAALEALLARRLGVAAENVLVTAGGDEALDRAARAVLGPCRELLLPVPSFEMFPRYARLAGADVVSVDWPGGPFPIDAVLAAISPRTAAIAVVSPNNPTGAIASEADLRRLSAAAPHALLMVDLAYTEFADVDLTPVALRLPNAITVRTLSKAWGLAGLRVGYAVGPADIIGWLRVAGSPYSVARPALAIAAAAVEQGAAAVDAFVHRVRVEREQMRQHLLGLGAEPLPSQANFVLSRFADAAGVHQRLARGGIAVRRFPDRPGLTDTLRITCPGDAGAFDRLLAALEPAVRPTGASHS